MAVRAKLYQWSEHIHLDWYLDEPRIRAWDDPHLPGYDPCGRLYHYFDNDKIEDHGIWEFLGVEVPYIDRLEEQDLEAIDRMNPPRIDIPEVGLFNVSVSDALRYARRVYEQQRATARARAS